MKKKLINIGNKSKKAIASQLDSKKKNKVLKNYCDLIKKILGYVSKSEIVHKDDMVKI